jgi:DNA-binding NarL/FixJ family response regulator
MKILIVEDQAMFRGVVAQICQHAFPAAAIVPVASAADALAHCERTPPDIILLDLDLPDAYGLDLLARFDETAPRARVIVLSAQTGDYVIHRCLQAGVDAFVDKNDEPVEAVTDAIASVRASRPYYSPVVGRVLALSRQDPEAFNKLLTDREQELLAWLGCGLSDHEVAEKLGLSFFTVQNHRRNIMGKLGIHTTAELARYALRKGFSPPPRPPRT